MEGYREAEVSNVLKSDFQIYNIGKPLLNATDLLRNGKVR